MNEKKLNGMTLGERLEALDLVKSYEKAVENKDQEKLRSLLETCHLNSEQINATIEQIIEPSSRPVYFKKQSRKLFLKYLFVYPLYYVMAMAVATLLLWWMHSWELNYALAWFKISAMIMGGASYFIHWRIGFYAFLDSLGK